MRYRTGATRDGTLVALEAQLISDSGAYAALSPWVLLYSLVTSTGPYRIPNVKVDATTVYTNNPIRERLPVLRIDPDVSGLRGPDGRTGSRAPHGPPGPAREKLSPQG
jgi:hypothetical protein